MVEGKSKLEVMAVRIAWIIADLGFFLAARMLAAIDHATAASLFLQGLQIAAVFLAILHSVIAIRTWHRLKEISPHPEGIEE